MPKVGTLKELLDTDGLSVGDVVKCVWCPGGFIPHAECRYTIYATHPEGRDPGVMCARGVDESITLSVPITNETLLFCIVSRASKEPKKWGAMSDEERAPILVAWSRGKDIQYYDYGGFWITKSRPFWSDCSKYRIKPEPREGYAVTLYATEQEAREAHPCSNPIHVKEVE